MYRNNLLENENESNSTKMRHTDLFSPAFLFNVKKQTQSISY